MGIQYSEKHSIPYYECDVTQYLKIPTMVKMLIKISGEQSARLGVSDEYMHSLGLGWIILQHDLDITRLPKAGEIVTLTTEADSYNKFFCYRHFWVHDEEGNEIAMMRTIFAIMDLNERKMGSVSDELIAPFESEKIKKIIRGEKIEGVENITAQKEYNVRFYDIDTNRHVNNAVYLDWVVDSLDAEFLIAHEPRKISIKFNKEIRYGEPVVSAYEMSEEGITKHRISSGDDVSCEAKITWETAVSE